MRSVKIGPYLALIALLTGTCGILITAVEVKFVDRDPVRMELPDTVGLWRGKKTWNCLNHDCGRMVMNSEVADGHPCPDCGEPLHGMSLAEARLLPPDTVMFRSEYHRSDRKPVNVAVVCSGKRRDSIHRPQVCLTAGGADINLTKQVQVDLEDNPSIAVKVLHLTRMVADERGRPVPFYSYYAYWFAGRNHETPHHLERMFWMAADKVLWSETYPWAYISLTGVRRNGSDDHLVEIEEFLRDLVPQLRLAKSDSG